MQCAAYNIPTDKTDDGHSVRAEKGGVRLQGPSTGGGDATGDTVWEGSAARHKAATEYRAAARKPTERKNGAAENTPLTRKKAREGRRAENTRDRVRQAARACW